MKKKGKDINVVFFVVALLFNSCGISTDGNGNDPSKPVASFHMSSPAAFVGQSVNFSDTSTGNPTSWQWEFGDGTTSSERNPSHSYSAAGPKTVRLTATNSLGSSTATRIVSVLEGIADTFYFSPVQPRVGEAVQFTDTSTGNPSSWLWDFGDGMTSTNRHPNHEYTTAGCYTITLTVTESAGTRTVKLPINILSTSAIMIDHHNTKWEAIPSEWIEAAKKDLHIAVGFTSHGSQMTYGMTGLADWKGDQYSWNFGGTGGALDLRFWLSSSGGPLGFGFPEIATIAYDLENPNRTAWEAATREYLALHPEINVVIWSWCSGMGVADSTLIQQYYLDLMAQLEVDFPRVNFVYMTGKTIGSAWGDGTTGMHWTYMNAKRIREHCLKNNRILYDFNDIESWDPDGKWYGDKFVTDACNYDSDGDGVQDRNWAIDWQNAHPGEWFDCVAPHTQPLNANLKAYAAWWLWARLAGWDGR